MLLEIYSAQYMVYVGLLFVYTVPEARMKQRNEFVFFDDAEEVRDRVLFVKLTRETKESVPSRKSHVDQEDLPIYDGSVNWIWIPLLKDLISYQNDLIKCFFWDLERILGTQEMDDCKTAL